MYPASFPGLGRGLDFLLPSFLVSRQEKKVGARWIRPTEYYFKDDECRKRDTFSRYNDQIIRKRITFLGYLFHRWNVLVAYVIRPYRVTRKRIAFLRSNVGAYCIRPTRRHPKDGECAKRDTFSGYKDLIIWKRITFLGYLFHRWNVLGAYAIRLYRVTWKRIAFLRYKDLIIRTRITFWIFIFDEWWKRGSFSGYNNHIIRKRITFFEYIDLVV